MDETKAKGEQHPVIEGGREGRVVDSRPRERRRTVRAVGLGHLAMIPGALLGLLVFWIITLIVPHHVSGWWWIAAFCVGAIAGLAITPLFSVASDDGADSSAVHDSTPHPGRADAPIEGAEEADLRRRRERSAR